MTNHHVTISGADENAAGNEKIAGLSFLDIEFAAFVEALGEHFRKALRHVLDDEDRTWKISRNLREQELQRVGASGRNPDCDDAIGRKRSTPRFLRNRLPLFDCCDLQAFAAGTFCDFYLFDELLSDGVEISSSGVFGFCNEIDR